MPRHDPRAIANAFIRRAKEEGKALTNMQLQKLPYIAHGYGLAVFDEPLIAEQPLTYPYGPVFRRLYQALKRYGAGEVRDFIHENDPSLYEIFRGDTVEANLGKHEVRLLNKIWQEYGYLDGLKLSTLTHQPKSPWRIVTDEQGAYMPIPNLLIQKHYKGLLK